MYYYHYFAKCALVAGPLAAVSWWFSQPTIELLFSTLTIICTAVSAIILAYRRVKRKDHTEQIDADRLELSGMIATQNELLATIAELTRENVALQRQQTEASHGCPVSRALLVQLRDSHKEVTLKPEEITLGHSLEQEGHK